MRIQRVLLGALVGLLLTGTVILAEGGFSQPWWSVGAGGMSAGDGYRLQGTVASVAPDPLRGGIYSLAGGSMPPVPFERSSYLYLPVLSR